MYLENVFLHGGQAPALPGYLPMSHSLHSVQSVSQVFVKLEQKNPAVAARTVSLVGL